MLIKIGNFLSGKVGKSIQKVALLSTILGESTNFKAFGVNLHFLLGIGKWNLLLLDAILTYKLRGEKSLDISVWVALNFRLTSSGSDSIFVSLGTRSKIVLNVIWGTYDIIEKNQSLGILFSLVPIMTDTLFKRCLHSLFIYVLRYIIFYK